MIEAYKSHLNELREQEQNKNAAICEIMPTGSGNTTRYIVKERDTTVKTEQHTITQDTNNRQAAEICVQPALSIDLLHSSLSDLVRSASNFASLSGIKTIPHGLEPQVLSFAGNAKIFSQAHCFKETFKIFPQFPVQPEKIDKDKHN